MSAEVLREAARLMRERAEAVDTTETALPNGEPYSWAEGIRFLVRDPDAAHIASWHPDVALAVAAFLETYAAAFYTNGTGHSDKAALAVARVYLGDA